MKKIEILAPAGSFDSVIAAVRSGADAVYLGEKAFSARSSAKNFDDEELKKATAYCHIHGVKVYVTINTIVFDDELEKLKKAIISAAEADVDALIVQNMGVARLAHRLVPDLALHASTQMSIHTASGVKALYEMGFKRVVLAREMSKKEIEKCCEIPVELEVFVHGALCMCVSGQCYLSAMIGARSGNRGSCAQPCRLPFSVNNQKGGHALSLKDNSIVNYLDELQNMGVASAKIEGRMKRPEYVAAAVTALKNSLSGEYSSENSEDLCSLFSRSGFTKGYYENALGRNMFGFREKENVTSATASLLKKYERIYEKERAVYRVHFVLSVKSDKKISLTASANDLSVTVLSESLPQKAVNRPFTKEEALLRLKKCGGTVFSFGDADICIDDGLSVSAAEMNALRREALLRLADRLKERAPYRINKANIIFQNRKPNKKPQTYISFRDTSAIPQNVECDKLFIPLSSKPELFEKYSAGAVLPRGIFGNFDEIVKRLIKSGARYALCNTLDSVAAAKKAGVQIIGGPFLNIFNSVSLSEIQKLGAAECVLSYEMTLKQLTALEGECRRGVCVYGRVPLMLTRNCPVKNGKSCRECGGKSFLRDRKGIEFPVRCTNGFSELFNSRPIYMADRMSEVKNADFVLLEFTTEDKEQISSVLKAYQNGSSPEIEFTRGLLYRGVE
jgi:putative protease